MPKTDHTPALTDAECVALCLDRVPKNVERVIVIYPAGNETACAWYGMSASQVVSHLYQVADTIIDQRGEAVEDRTKAH